MSPLNMFAYLTARFFILILITLTVIDEAELKVFLTVKPVISKK